MVTGKMWRTWRETCSECHGVYNKSHVDWCGMAL